MKKNPRLRCFDKVFESSKDKTLSIDDVLDLIQKQIPQNHSLVGIQLGWGGQYFYRYCKAIE